MLSENKPPQLEHFGPMVLAGHLRSHRLPQDPHEMYRALAAQWRELAEVAETIPVLPPRLGYGVALCMHDGADHFEYFAGFAVPSRARVPRGFDALEIPLVSCAVFEHNEHVGLLRATIERVFGRLLPLAGYQPAEPATGAPEFIKRYHEGFDPDTGLGGVDLLVPIKL